MRKRVYKYIVVKDNDDKQIVFCGMDERNGVIIASESSYKDARLFTSKQGADECAYKLNSSRYGSGGWYVRAYYI